MHIKKLYYLLGLAVLVPLVVVLMFFATGGMFDCFMSEQIKSRSPDGAYSALLIEKACGATTAKATHVVVRSLGMEQSILIAEGDLIVSFEWLLPKRLLVTNQSKSRSSTRIYESRDESQGLNIEFEGF